MNYELTKRFIEKTKEDGPILKVEDILFIDMAFKYGIEGFLGYYLDVADECKSNVLFNIIARCRLLREAKSAEYQKQISRVFCNEITEYVLENIELEAAKLVSDAPSEEHATFIADIMEIKDLNEALNVGRFAMLEIAKTINKTENVEHARVIRDYAVSSKDNPEYVTKGCDVLLAFDSLSMKKHVIGILNSDSSQSIYKAMLIMPFVNNEQTSTLFELLKYKDEEKQTLNEQKKLKK